MANVSASRLAAVPTTTAREIMLRHKVEHVLMHRLTRLTGAVGRAAGRARTLRFLPLREDVQPPAEGRLARVLIESLAPEEVLVVDALGCDQAAVLGDMLAARTANLGASAVIIDGSIRDVEGISALGLQVFARGAHPDPSSRLLMAWESDVPIQCGGALVQPGDWILADADAVIVVPADLVSQVVEQGEEANLRDEFSQLLLKTGLTLDEAYPLPRSLDDLLARYRHHRVLPDRDELQRALGKSR